MKRSISYIVIAIILVLGAFALIRKEPEGESASGTGISGVVAAIDLEQAMVDGPYVVTVQDDNGSERDVKVPSMGIMLCAARESIMSPSELKVGDRVEARGALTAEGDLVPCESPDHYLRLASER
ncbi:MAG: hypothetical protein HZA81_01730 [Candidatus Taylorbacteria bacterium]|nr:hypothetical protein [Candidatus Taylorbacteria bacterium]